MKYAAGDDKKLRAHVCLMDDVSFAGYSVILYNLVGSH